MSEKLHFATTTESKIIDLFAQRRDSLPRWAHDLLAPWVRLPRYLSNEVTIPNNPDLSPCAFCGHGTTGTSHMCPGLMPRPHQCDWRVASVMRISGGVSPKEGHYAVDLECYQNHRHQKTVTLDSLPLYFGEVTDDD